MGTPTPPAPPAVPSRPPRGKAVAEAWQALRARLATTPGQMQAAIAATAVLAVVFYLAVAAAVEDHRRGLQTVARDSIPSIIAAQEIKANLADLHSSAANVLLGSADAARDYEKRRKDVNDFLLQAARNITYPEEEALVRRLLHKLGAYEEAVARARALHNFGLQAEAVAWYREADRVVRAELFASADNLDRANRGPLDAAFARQGTAAAWAMLWVIGSGLALLGVLVATQVFLLRRLRRILNPGLLAASVLVLVFLGFTAYALASERRALRVVKEDAFQSIHALEQARAVAYDANGDESRWLLDRDRAAAHDAAFRARAAQLLDPVPDPKKGDVLQAVRQAKGYLASELNNITFTGEEDAARAAVLAWLDYLTIDAAIRRLENEGKHAEAVRLCLGSNRGESNWAFEQFDQALGKTIDINRQAMEAAERRGFALLAAVAWLNPVAALAAVLAAFLGLRPRLREYAV